MAKNSGLKPTANLGWVQISTPLLTNCVALGNCPSLILGLPISTVGLERAIFLVCGESRTMAKTQGSRSKAGVVVAVRLRGALGRAPGLCVVLHPL